MKPGSDVVRINNILKDLYSSVKADKINLNGNMVYGYLIRHDVSVSERKFNISSEVYGNENLFRKWINRFRNAVNIRVFQSDNWRYFCQFINGNINMQCVKVYIPLKYDYLYEGANMIFDFLAQNNISHRSKIGSEIRFDNIVVRLNNLEDAKKLQEFVESNSYIKKGFINSNPFAFSNKGVSYAYDGGISYNGYLANLIAGYINYAAKKPFYSPNKVNIDSFYKYVDDVSKDFRKINSFNNYGEDYLADCYLVIELIKKSLKSNDMNEYYEFVNYAMNDRTYKSVKNAINHDDVEKVFSIKQIDDYVNKELLFKEFILTSMKKYPSTVVRKNGFDGYDLIFNFLKGHITAVSRDNGLRERINENLNVEDVYDIINDSDVSGYDFNDKLFNYVKKVMLEDIIKNMMVWANVDNNEEAISIANNQIMGFIEKNNSSYISYSCGKVRTLTESFSAREMKTFLDNCGCRDVNDYYYMYMEANLKKKGRY